MEIQYAMGSHDPSQPAGMRTRLCRDGGRFGGHLLTLATCPPLSRASTRPRGPMREGLCITHCRSIPRCHHTLFPTGAWEAQHPGNPIPHPEPPAPNRCTHASWVCVRRAAVPAGAARRSAAASLAAALTLQSSCSLRHPLWASHRCQAPACWCCKRCVTGALTPWRLLPPGRAASCAGRRPTRAGCACMPASQGAAGPRTSPRPWPPCTSARETTPPRRWCC